MSGDAMDFIICFRKHPCMWRVSDPNYNNKSAKAQAMEELIAIMKRRDPIANKHTVLKKINSMRTNFRREYGKYRRSHPTGSPKQNNYVPKNAYFNDLMFLSDPGAGRNYGTATKEKKAKFSVSSHMDSISECEDSNASRASLMEDEAASKAEVIYLQDNVEASQDVEDSKYSLHQILQLNEPPKEVPHTKEPEKETPKVTNCEELDVFGQYVALQMANIDPQHRIFAKHLINEVLYLGEIKKLTFDTKIVPN